MGRSLTVLRIVGLEPTRGHPREILSLVRLPFRHIRVFERKNISIQAVKMQVLSGIRGRFVVG